MHGSAPTARASPLDAQQSALVAAGAERVFAEKISGAVTDRKALARAIAELGPGDCLLVTRLDRLARSTRDLLNVLDAVAKAGAAVQAVIATLSLSLPVNADRQIERVGEVIYLVEPNSEKPIYTFSVQFGAAKLSLATQLTEAIVSDAAKRISNVISVKTLARPDGPPDRPPVLFRRDRSICRGQASVYAGREGCGIVTFTDCMLHFGYPRLGWCS